MDNRKAYSFKLLEPDEETGVVKMSKKSIARLQLNENNMVTIRIGEKSIQLRVRPEPGIRDNRIRLDRKAMEGLSARDGDDAELSLSGEEDDEGGQDEVANTDAKGKNTRTDSEDENDESIFNGASKTAEEIITEVHTQESDEDLEKRLRARMGKIIDWMKELDAEYRTREEDMRKKAELMAKKREDERIRAVEEEYQTREEKKEEEMRAEMERKEKELAKLFEEKLKEIENDRIQKVILEQKLEFGKKLREHGEVLTKKEDELRKRFEDEYRKKLEEMEQRLKIELNELEEEKMHMLEFEHKRKLREKTKELELALEKKEEELRKRLDEEFRGRFSETVKKLEAEAKEREDAKQRMLELEYKRKLNEKI